MTAISNLFANIPPELRDELFETLLDTNNLRLERIVSRGHTSPPGFWYDQETDEWVVLLAGAARLQFEGDEQPVELRPGDCLSIGAHRRHRVEWTDPAGPTVWLALHYRTG